MKKLSKYSLLVLARKYGPRSENALKNILKSQEGVRNKPKSKFRK